MTDYIWPLVALVTLVLGYRVIMRWLGNNPRDETRALSAYAQKIRADFDAHVKTWDGVAIEWRAKVRELDAKCDRVVIDAKNEIAGDLATVSNITSKGWR